MEVFLINLNCAVERLERMGRMLRGAGLQYQRVAATDGRELSATAVEQYNALGRF